MGSAATFDLLTDLALDSSGSYLYALDRGTNGRTNKIRQISTVTGDVTTVASGDLLQYSPTHIEVDEQDRIWVAVTLSSSEKAIIRYPAGGGTPEVALSNLCCGYYGDVRYVGGAFTIDPTGTHLYYNYSKLEGSNRLGHVFRIDVAQLPAPASAGVPMGAAGSVVRDQMNDMNFGPDGKLYLIWDGTGPRDIRGSYVPQLYRLNAPGSLTLVRGRMHTSPRLTFGADGNAYMPCSQHSLDTGCVGTSLLVRRGSFGAGDAFNIAGGVSGYQDGSPGRMGSVVGIEMAPAEDKMWFADASNRRIRASTVPYPLKASEAFGANRSMPGDCPCNGNSNDAVNTRTGNEHFRLPGVSVPGRGPGLSFEMAYNSLDANYDGPMGHGWRHTFDMQLVDNGSGAKTWVQETGATVPFNEGEGGSWTTPRQFNATLTDNGDGTWTIERNHFEFFTFDTGGRLISIGDRNGYETVLVYDSSDLLDYVEDGAGRRLDFSWANGRVASITDPRSVLDGGPRSLSFTYDAAGDLSHYTDIGGGQWVMTYDTSHRLTSARPPRHSDPAKAFKFHYDTAGRVDWEEDTAGRRTSLFYDDPAPGATRLVEPDGDTRVDWYNPIGQRVKVTNGYGTASAATTEYVYDLYTFMVTKMIDGNGKQRLYRYDDPSNPHLRTSTTDPLNRTTSTTYNSLGQVLTTTDAMGVTSEFSYDAAGNVEEAVAAVGTAVEAVTDFVRGDPAHPDDVTATIDPRGNTWAATFDPATGDRLSSTDPAGNTTTNEYNSLGWMTVTVAPAGNTVGATPSDFRTTFLHDVYGRVVSTTNPEAETSTTSYDPNGNVEWVEDNDGERTTYTYNDADELIVEHRPDTTQVLYDYWPDGSLKTRTGPAGNIWNYAYDPLDRVSTSIDPLNRQMTYTYDGVGNRTQMQQPDGDCAAGTGCVSYSYDAANQLSLIDYSDPATADVSFTYDGNGRRRTMTDGTGTSTSVWDELGRLDTHTDGLGQTIDYSFDAVGNVTGILYPGQTIPVTRAYDAAGRLESVTDWLGNTSTFGWDANTNLDAITFPTKTGNVDTFSYDRADRLSSVEWTGQSGTYASETYGRQPDGLLSSITETGLPDGPAAFDYDQLDQLTGLDAASNSYTYDPADNLTRLPDRTTQAFDAASQLSYTQRPITEVGTAKAHNNTAATMNLALPGGMVRDDQILMFVTVPKSQSVTATPAGYAYVTERAATEGAKMYLYRRTAAGGETNVSVNFSGLGTYPKTLMAVVYRGVDPLAPIDALGTSDTGAPSSTITVGSITTSRPGARLVMAQAATGSLLQQSFTQPPGMGNRVDQSNQILITSAVGDQTIIDAGPTGSRTATYSTSDQRLVGMLLALKPQRTTFGYDPRGNRETRTDPRGVMTTYGYDQADRLVDVNGTTSYAYDGNGLRAATTTPAGSTGFVWDRTTGIPLMLTETPLDAQGQPITAKTTSYVYGPGGQVLTRIDPRPDIQLVGTDAVSNAGTATALTLTLPGNIKANDQIIVSATHPNNASVATPAGYTEIATWTGASSTLRGWRRRATGTETSITLNFSSTLSVKAATVAVYRGVDPNNPIVSKGFGANNGTSVTIPALTASDAGDQFVAVTGATHLLVGPTGWTPPPGMTTRAHTGSGTVSAIVADQRLTAAGATGQRVFGYESSGSLIAAGLVLRRLPTPERWHHADHLGSTRVLTDETGSTVGTTTYDPYGAIGQTTGETSRLGFAGEYTDPSTGLIYLRARWYDPTTGQFLTRDPLVDQTHEPYGYASNDPINTTDPLGLFGWNDVKDAAGGAVDTVKRGAGAVVERGRDVAGAVGSYVDDHSVGLAQVTSGLSIAAYASCPLTAGVGCTIGGGLSYASAGLYTYTAAKTCRTSGVISRDCGLAALDAGLSATAAYVPGRVALSGTGAHLYMPPVWRSKASWNIGLSGLFALPGGGASAYFGNGDFYGLTGGDC